MISVQTRRALAADARAGFPSRRAKAGLVRARAAFARAVWNANGERRLPTAPELDRALEALPPPELEWLCELAPLGPLYLLPTTRWISTLAVKIRSLGARRVLEVGAGDGFVSRCLAKAAPGLEVRASDSGAWTQAQARMNEEERTRLAGSQVPGVRLGEEVWRTGAVRAIGQWRPDLVLACWLPPGPLLDRIVRTNVRWVLEVGAAGGVTPGAWSWRLNHDFCDGEPVETLARCRLDARPRVELHSRVTLYFGAAHPDHAVARVKEGDWLWQFKPES